MPGMFRALLFLCGWGWLALGAWPCAAETTAGPFEDLPFAAALKQAQAENKIVFIDFFTTWCGPCKKLDATT